MKKIWTLVNQTSLKRETKNQLFLILEVIITGSIGCLLWLTLGRLLLSGLSWLICFICYPAYFIGFFGGLLYLCNHEFGIKP